MSDISDFRSLAGRFLLPYWPRTLALVFLSMVAASLASAYPIMLAPIMDIGSSVKPAAAERLGEINLNNAGVTIAQFVLGRDQADQAAIAAVAIILFAALGIAAALVQFVAQALSASVTLGAQRDLQCALYGHVIRQDMAFFNASRSGDLASRFVVDAGEVMSALDLAIRQGLQSVLQIVIYGALLIQTAPRLALATALVSLGHLGVNRLIGGRLRRSAGARMDDLGQLSSKLNETFSAIRAIKAAAIEAYEGGRFSAIADASRRVAFGYTVTKNAETPLRNVADILALGAVLAIAILEFRSGLLTFQGLILFMAVVRFTIAPISLCAQAFTRLHAALGSGRRVLDTLRRSPDLADGVVVPNAFSAELRLDRVTFGYTADRPILQDVSVSLRRGELLAIVGASGAGKSTLVDLVLRLHDPQSGQVRLDGVDVREFVQAEYRKLFGVVSQESLLFNDTIRNNIIFGRPTGDESDLDRAADIANAVEFISALPDGYETVVGDRGVRLSGGQRQRMAIARAIYAKPQILILDEATSALDSTSERLVQQAIDRVLTHATAIVIAHRLSTIMHADRIVVLNAGRIEAVGRHDELLQTSTTYRKFCELQAASSGPRLASATSIQRQ